MNRIIVISTVLILALGTALSAQSRSNRISQIQSQKIAFLTKKMDLSVEEAERFWPLYNEYVQKKEQLEQAPRTTSSEMTETLAREILEQQLANAEKEIAFKRDFFKKASKVVSYQKLYQLEKGEREFRIMILNRYRDSKPRRGR